VAAQLQAQVPVPLIDSVMAAARWARALPRPAQAAPVPSAERLAQLRQAIAFSSLN
jgi:Asp/Glu/hydantoin racemase